MPKINQEEYELLKSLDDYWKWIARDSLREGLYIHKDKPFKYQSYWEDEENICSELVADLFQFIQWEDEEPYNIAELIREYEWAQLNEKYPPVRESEEKEVKNIEELKSWFEDEKLYVGEYVKHKIDQLDEPEVLSQELPVIPKFVADFIEENDRSLLLIGYMYYENNITDSKLDNWISENTETLYRTCLDGYTIEEDTKYRVQIGGHFVKFDSEGNMSTTTRSNSITTKPKLHSLVFNLDKAVESGLVKIEELEE